jgi:hypothetical protein
MAPLQADNAFNVGCVWEEIERLDGQDLVLILEESQVASQGGRVARDIDDPLGGKLLEGFHHLRVHAGPGWIGNHHLGESLRSSSQALVDPLFQISRQKLAIAQAIESPDMKASATASGTSSNPTTRRT